MQPEAERTIIASVAVDQSVITIDRLFDYIVPAHLVGKALTGSRALVPFGAGNSKKTGMIVKLREDAVSPRMKYIIDVLDTEPVLTDKMLALAAYIREHTFCTWYSAIRVLLPPGINFKVKLSFSLSESVEALYPKLDATQKQVVDYMRSVGAPLSKETVLSALSLTSQSDVIEKLVQKGAVIRSGEAVRSVGDASQKMIRATEAVSQVQPKLTPKQKQAVSVLSEVGCCSLKELCYFTGLTSAVASSLVKKGLAEVFEQEYYRNPYSGVDSKDCKKIVLTEEQNAAYDRLLDAYNDPVGRTALLFGITGSGKTQVFLKLCETVADSGRGVIVMVPEIALTPQTLSVFHRRFGGKVAVFHSAMSQGQRLDEWKRIKRGEARVAVGTRSAVFAPFSDVGLIIMDEEHEHTYKSEMSPHFHARDIARYRVAESGGLLLLSSATPSFESYSRALAGKYLLLRLTKRYGSASLPEVEIADTRRDPAILAGGIVGTALYERVTEALDSGNQAILLLNRRGYNTYVSCPSCGHVMTCDSCSISMTYHSANNRLMCHYCGRSVPFTETCPVCGCKNMKYTGIGTQKAEAELNALFKGARVLRMDADSTMTRNDYEKNLSAFAEKKFDILLGTQMVAKGLDFPHVTVVGVLNADSSLHSSDFRSYERTFSLLTQVVGRSGRGDSPGVAVIQTAEPDSNLIKLAAQQDYVSFYESEILTRRLMIYPPYCDIAAACFSGEDRRTTEDAAKEFLNLLKFAVTDDYKDIKIITLGPTAAAVPKVNSQYRYKLIIKYKNSVLSRKMLADVYSKFLASGFSKRISAYINVNPDSII